MRRRPRLAAFAVAAAVLAAALVGAAELVMRAAGVAPLESEENARWQDQMSRPLYERPPFARTKGRTRLALIGESNAWLYFRALQGLKLELPELATVDLVDCSAPAAGPEGVAARFDECLGYGFDAALVLAGHNVASTLAPRPAWRRWAGRSRLVGALKRSLFPPPRVQEDVAYSLRLAGFERVLSRILAESKARGARVAVCTMPSNLWVRPWGPASEDYDRALAAFAAGRRAEAGRLLNAARDGDLVATRATSRVNDAIRRIARERGATLVDLQPLADADGGGAPGWEQFSDNVHPNTRTGRFWAATAARALGVLSKVPKPAPARVEVPVLLDQFGRFAQARARAAAAYGAESSAPWPTIAGPLSLPEYFWFHGERSRALALNARIGALFSGAAEFSGQRAAWLGPEAQSSKDRKAQASAH